jgi:hypothetical protein
MVITILFGYLFHRRSSFRDGLWHNWYRNRHRGMSRAYFKCYMARYDIYTMPILQKLILFLHDFEHNTCSHSYMDKVQPRFR